MKIDKFNEKYKLLGGFTKLSEMRKNLLTLQEIAKCFGVTKTRIAQLMVLFFGEKYDPRMQRRERMICAMIEFAKEHTEREFIEAYRLQNFDYFYEAVRRIKGNNLFKKDE
jgi:predicted transcriptional regulator